MDIKNIFGDYEKTASRMAENGVLLVTGKEGNPMTIGWGQLGISWGLPVFTVMVRPSRYSYSLIDEEREFTVNVMPEGAGKIMGVCGARSGRDMDKKEECGLTPVKSASISIPGIREAEIIYECRIIHENELVPTSLPPGLLKKYYPAGDFHTFYYGEVLNLVRH